MTPTTLAPISNSSMKFVFTTFSVFDGTGAAASAVIVLTEWCNVEVLVVGEWDGSGGSKANNLPPSTEVWRATCEGVYT